MATYRQLLLSTGGGVISGAQQDEQNTGATIAIGLGGTGVACLRNLKKQIYTRLQPDDTQSPIPEYSHIKFLAVDSDASSLGTDGDFDSLDKATEFFDISTPDINGLLSQTKTLANTPECKWLKTKSENGEGLKILSATAGAGGVRQIGRLLLVEKSAEFVSKLQHIITDATRGIQGDAELIIHIFAGIGGGTGSGTFLDVCYLLQEALKRLGQNGKALTCGYFFLPDVNLSKTSISEGSAISRYIKANGFAAMKELNHCMNFESNQDRWSQEYKGFTVDTQEQPVKVCHLISAHDVEGTTLENGFDYAMNVVSDFVMQFLVKPASTGSDALTMTGHIGNYSRSIGVVDKTAGANYQYCLLGASNATVPMREITTYLASRLFEEMSKVSTRKPTDQEVDKFAEDNGLTYQALMNAILNGTRYNMPAIELDYKQAVGMNEQDMGIPDELDLPAMIMTPYRDRLQSDMIGKVTANAHAMTNDWSIDEIKKDQTSTSKVIATFFALRNILVDPKYGPFYAADLLNGPQTMNLVNCLRGVQEQAKNDLDSTRADISLAIQNVKRLRGEFLHAKLGKDKKFENFMGALAGYFTLDSKRIVLEQLLSILPVMTKQFINLYDVHFKIYQSVCRNLFDTFHENYQTLSNEDLTGAIADPFVMPLMSISSMKDSLDASVNSLKMDVQAQNFHTFFFDQPLVWNASDPHKISKTVSGYLVEVFRDYTEKTITNYLELRFDTTDPGKLGKNVYDEILEPLTRKADALFWKAPGFDITVAQLIGYVSIPDSASVIIEAADKLLKVEHGLSKCPGKMKDRISILKCLCGVPMYAYNGINDYEREYLGDKDAGKHLYEMTLRDPRDWRALSNLRPYSTDNDTTDEIEARAANYDRAEELGIVRPNPMADNEYELVRYPDIDKIMEDAQQAMDSGNVNAMNKASLAIAEYQENAAPARVCSIANDGAPGHEAKVRKDHVVDSKMMCDIIKEELDKKAKLIDALERLQSTKSGISSGMMLKDNFFNALYTGVISVNVPRVTYTEERRGMKVSETVLSEPAMEPYGKLVPLYQAYVTYSNMPEEARKAMDDLALKRMSGAEWQTVMQDSCESLEQTFSDKYLGVMQQKAEMVPDHTKEIVSLLLDFVDGIDNFKTTYGLD